MKGMLAGVTVGLILGMAVTASAVRGWYSIGEWTSENGDFRRGYIGGVSDMLDALADDHALNDYYAKKLTCLDSHSTSLKALTVWADAAVLRGINQGYSKDHAARFVVISACEP